MQPFIIKSTVIQKTASNRSLDKYFSEINKIPVLSADEQFELFVRYSETKSKDVFDRILKSNLRFVVSVAKSYKTHTLKLEDLINEGNIGLMKAINKFNHTRGFKFITYAVWWIRDSIQKAITEHDNMIYLPTNREKELAQYQKAYDYISLTKGEKPSVEELSDFLGWKVGMVMDVQKQRVDPIQMDSEIFDINEVAETSTIEGEPIDGLRRVIKTLEEREAAILMMYFGFDHLPVSADEIAKLFGLSDERVRQICKTVVKDLASKKHLILQ